MKRAAVVRHLLFEDLGSFESVLRDCGWDVAYHDAGIDPLDDPALAESDLLIVLGGPIGAYEDETYPFLRDELRLLDGRLAKRRPTIGICLGAQLIARALGGRVYPSGGKEIGWGPIALTEAGTAGPLRHLDGVDVLHWHGDTFDLPPDCSLLASTALCRNQAFAVGNWLLALQFHPEATARTFERWLIGHACELAAAGIDPRPLREGLGTAAAALEIRGAKLLRQWLADLAI
jgi:GMP synthase (glutamine-hydrolysing)